MAPGHIGLAGVVFLHMTPGANRNCASVVSLHKEG